MARPTKATEKLENYSFRITSSLRREMRHAAGKLDKEDAEALRQAATIGFRFLRLIDYDCASAIIDAAMRKLSKNGEDKGA